MESTINFNTKLKEAASFGQPITEYDPASKGFKDFHKLARELMGPQPRLTLNLPAAAPRAVPAAEPDEPMEVALSTAQADYFATGFLTNGREDEKKCPEMWAEILESISDVSTRVA